MLRVTTGGLSTLRQSYKLNSVLTRFPLSVARRNMSSSQAKQPVSLLGTMAFGGRADAAQSLDMVKAFLDRGHRLVDTALMYVDGKSEEIIGNMNLPKTGVLAGHKLLANSVLKFASCVLTDKCFGLKTARLY